MPHPGEDDAAGSEGSPENPTQEIPLNDEGEAPPPEARNRKRKFVIIGVAAVLVVGLALGLGLGLTGGSPATGLVVTTQVVKVTTGNIQQTVAASGTLEPASQANLDFGVSGVVTAVDVQAGQVVTAGQVLATVGTSALQADVNSAEAQLQSAQARLSSDEASGAQTTQIDSDEASVTSAESALTSAQTDLGDASLQRDDPGDGGLGQPHRRPAGHGLGFRRLGIEQLRGILRECGQLECCIVLDRVFGTSRDHQYRLVHREHDRR